jgi:putative flippase GtrA
MAIRLIAVGGGAAAIDLGGFLTLVACRVPVPIAAASSFLMAAAFNYLCSSRLVFRSRPTVRRFGVFLAFGMIGLLVNAGTTWMASESGLPPYQAKIAGIGLAFFFNAAMNVLVVFRNTRLDPRAAPAPTGPLRR